MPTKVKIVDGENATLKYTKQESIQGWRDPELRFWKIQTNPNEQRKVQSPTQKHHTGSRPPKNHAVKNVLELPSSMQIVHYYHAGARFSTEETWLTAIKASFYSSWSLLMEKAMK